MNGLDVPLQQLQYISDFADVYKKYTDISKEDINKIILELEGEKFVIDKSKATISPNIEQPVCTIITLKNNKEELNEEIIKNLLGEAEFEKIELVDDKWTIFCGTEHAHHIAHKALTFKSFSRADNPSSCAFTKPATSRVSYTKLIKDAAKAKGVEEKDMAFGTAVSPLPLITSLLSTLPSFAKKDDGKKGKKGDRSKKPRKSSRKKLTSTKSRGKRLVDDSFPTLSSSAPDSLESGYGSSEVKKYDLKDILALSSNLSEISVEFKKVEGLESIIYDSDRVQTLELSKKVEDEKAFNISSVAWKLGKK
ncbi:hypothetical protein ADUPG1_008183 [Aduncisulcus paluster]|uniref:Uncharacterized protein n=1 Tax=Aduncisulcus paluster TaxID=2918883 RepID=A0ABQ5KR24_9EUKA|nr:hypothetical protein ADUPG1_008183 [Aduncisulcus paluster]